MAHGGSRRVVIIALVANLAIALAKLVAAVFTRSGSMLAEAIHSFADTGNQVLLLVGDSRSSRKPDDHFPLGYGREAYFWAMLVAVVLFTLGGIFSGYEGMHKLQHPEPVKHVFWGLGVLVVAVVIEAASCKAAWTEFRRSSRGLPLFRWARVTGDVNLLVVVFEDLAALLGLFIALVALMLTWLTGEPIFDAVGTLVLSALLLGVALFLGSQVRRLIAGHSIEPERRAELEAIWTSHGFKVVRLMAVWAGPERIMVAAKVVHTDDGLSAAELIRQINVAEAAVRERMPRVFMQFSEPDLVD